MSCGNLPLFESVNVYLTPCLSVFGTPADREFLLGHLDRARRRRRLRARRAQQLPGRRWRVMRIGRKVTPSESDAPSTRGRRRRFARAGRRRPAASRFGRRAAARARPRPRSGSEQHALAHAQVERRRERLEVRERAEVDVGRLVPGLRQRRASAACGPAGRVPRAGASARSSGRRRCPTGATRIIPATTAAGRRVVCSVHESSTTSKAPSSKSRSASSMSPSVTGTPGARCRRARRRRRSRRRGPRSRARRSGARAGRRRRSRGRARASPRGTMPRDDLEVGPHRRSADLAPHALDECGHGAVVLGHRQQERVVAVRRGDLAERDRDARRRRAGARSRASARSGSASRCRTRARGSACGCRAAARSPRRRSPNGSK